jgi:NADH-quinone oxidoreductase subunit H
VVIPVCLAGTLNLHHIARQQTGGFWEWNIFHDPFTYIAFFVFFITATASCKRAPFDLAEAESELVAGFHTEYSGFRWSIFFLAEYGSMFAVSGLAAHLYLGGWHSGLLPFEPAETWGPIWGNLLNVGVFATKCWILVLVMMWLRWTLPRLRIDQVMETCLFYLLPISCVLLAGVCLWQVTIPTDAGRWIRYLLAGLTALAGIALVIGLLRPLPQNARRGQLPGAWKGQQWPSLPLSRSGQV